MTSEKNATLREYVLVVCLVVPIVLAGCALGIAADLHQARLEFASANAAWRRETFLRIDRLLWKADTGLEIAAAARLDIGNVITKLRAQVKQSSEDSTHASAAQSKAATVAVTQALDKTSEAIQAVAGESPEKPPEENSRAPITVNVPPPVVMNPEKPAAGAPQVEITPRPVKRRRWYSLLWPGNWRP